MTLTVVSRSSSLAQVQVDEALAHLQPWLSGADRLEFRVVTALSYGDRNKTLSLLDGSAPPDLFTRELDEELRARRADFAVHSAKDLALPLAADLDVVALLPPADRTEALVCRPGLGPTLEALPPGARIGTSSPDRRDRIAALRPDLTVVGIRGTIEERLAQVDRGDYEAVVVATCALHRLGLEGRINEILPFPAHPLQGYLAITALRSRDDLRRLWAPVDVRRHWGRVSLVGAGPGDPELLTLKGARLLAEADLVLTDSLADPRLVEGLRAEVQLVGKRGDAGGELQARINEALYQAALRGLRVVRLKGGDPMVFGRASEELDYLEQRLVPFDLVPGISSAQAASAFTQIPLTERGVSASVAFVLGAPADRITVPDAETLVYYMASATLGAITTKLVEAGRPRSTPLALVRNASLADQQTWRRSLGELVDELAAHPDHPYASPLLLFVGPVARPGRLSSWFDRLPLTWYTGTNPDRYQKPCRLVHHPLVRFEPLADPSGLDARLQDLGGFGWVVFTSRHTVEAVFDRLEALNLDVRAFSGVKVAAVGRSTAHDLATRGLRADLVPDLESAAGLVEAFSHHAAEEAIFLPCSDQALADLTRGLTALGARVERLTAYHTVAVDTAPSEVDLARFDEVVLTSPSTARAFARLFPTPPENLILTPMGAQTARTLGELFPGRQLGDRVSENR